MGGLPTYMVVHLVGAGIMVDSWTETMTARERVTTIAETLSEPRNPNWVAEQADVKWDTAKKYLEEMADQGTLLKTEDERYYPDPARAYFDHIRELIVENDKDELRGELEIIATEIEDWQTEYDVESLDELEDSLGDESLSASEVRERRRVARQWEENKQYRDLFTTALSLYDEVMSLFTPHSKPSDAIEGTG